MLRLQFEKAPPSHLSRSEMFPVSVVIVNENGLPPGTLASPPVLTISLRNETGDAIPGNPLLAVASKGSWNAHTDEGTPKNTAKFKMSKHATIDVDIKVLSRCNGQHYAGSTQHTDTCYHTIKHPLQLVFTAAVQVKCSKNAAGANDSKSKAVQAAEAKSKTEAKKGRKGTEGKSGKGGGEGGNEGGEETVMTVDVMGLVAILDIGKNSGGGGTGEGTEEGQADNEEDDGGHHGAAYKQGGGCRLIPFAGENVCVEEWPKYTRQCTGAIVWDNAWLTLRHIEGIGRAAMRKKSVVDLGCGTGLVGLCAAVLGASVLLTDMDHALDLPRRNAVRNAALVGKGGGDVEVRVHEWGTDVTPLLRGSACVDFVIACEVVYQPESYPSLVASIRALSGPKTQVLLAVRRRHGTEVDTFLDLMRQHFALNQMPSWAQGLGTAARVSTDITRVKEQPDFFIAKLLTR